MKKRLSLIVILAMLLSLTTVVTTSASAIFDPAGDVEIGWLSEAQVAGIEFDGNIDEWRNFDLPFKALDQTNLITWEVGGDQTRFDEPDAIGRNFAINAYFAADADYLYVALDIDDEHFARGSGNGGSYNGDAVMLGLDWNCHIEDELEKGVDYQNNKDIFYSFSCGPEDGEELIVRIQEGFKDRDISESTSSDPTRPDMKGSAGATQNGWCAELALSWELLYGDFEYKTWDSPIDQFGQDYPLTLGMTLCYLNRAETNGTIQWAAGTFDNDTAYPDWEPPHNGMYATLNWAAGREVNCSNIVNVGGSTTTQPSIMVEKTLIEDVRADAEYYWVQIANSYSSCTLKFTPTVSGEYVFRSVAQQSSWGKITPIDDDHDVLASDMTPEEDGFFVSCWLEAGVTYGLETGIYTNNRENYAVAIDYVREYDPDDTDDDTTAPAPAHKHEFKETVVAPTCTESGYTLYECECGQKETVAIPTEGHTFVPFELEHQGMMGQVCSVCGMIQTDALGGVETETAVEYRTDVETETEGVSYNKLGELLGCQAVLTSAALLPVMALAGAVVIRKKKD